MAFSMLFRRGAVWTFGKVIPVTLRPVIGRTAYVVSLQTTDLETAKARYPAELHAAVLVKDDAPALRYCIAGSIHGTASG